MTDPNPLADEAVAAYVERIDGEALAKVIRDEVATHTGQLARLIAGSPDGLHPSLYGQRLEDAMEVVASYAEVVTAHAVLRVLHGAELARATA